MWWTVGLITLLCVLLANIARPVPVSADTSCDPDGLQANYSVGYSSGPPDGYHVTSVVVTGIATACLGSQLSVSVLRDGVVLASGGPVQITGGTMNVALAGAPLAAAVTQVHAEILTITEDSATATATASATAVGANGGGIDITPLVPTGTPAPSNTPAPGNTAAASNTAGPSASSDAASSAGPSIPSSSLPAVSTQGGTPESQVLSAQTAPSPVAMTPPIAAQLVTPTPTPTPQTTRTAGASHTSDRPSITANFPGLGAVQTSLGAILTNIGLAALLLGLVLIDTTIFNSILKENSDLIHAFVQRNLGLLRGITHGTDFLFGQHHGRDFALRPALILSLSALVYCVLDPNFGFNNSTLVLFLSLIFSLAVATYVNDGGQVLVAEKRFGIPYMIQFFPAAMFIAGVSVLVSRFADIQPGIIFGFVASAKQASRFQPAENEEGAINYYPMLALLLVSLCAWVAISPAHTYAAEHGFVGAAVEAALVMLFVGSIQGLLFTLIPLKFLDGLVVWTWSKLAWLSLMLPVTFLFFHTVLNEQGTLSSATGHRGVIVLYATAIVAWAITGAAWLYFKKVNKGEGEERIEDLESSRH